MARTDLLDNISRSVVGCGKCRLARTRKKAVPGAGSKSAVVMVVGQCPGFHEDDQGKPFVGKAGALLNQLLVMARVPRESTFITNIVKCRPPENRDPMVDEVRACKPYLDGQIKILNPKVIVALGRFATEYFIKGASISELHGKPMAVNGRIVLPLYHPAAALRSTGVAEELEKDFMLLPKLLTRSADEFEAANSKNEDENQLGLI